jgi:prepilin-type N-terminal cleavage/methylation domain-containing protein
MAHAAKRSRAGRPAFRPAFRPGYTLIEFLAVMVIIGILGGLAIPSYFDWDAHARAAADEASIAAIRTALVLAHTDHAARDAPDTQWIDEVKDIAALMENGKLPAGIVIVGGKLEDMRGNTYALTAETATSPAVLELESMGVGS